MRYNHNTVKNAKKVLVIRLGYVINLLMNQGRSVKNIADDTTASYHGLLAIKNGKVEQVSFEHLLTICDRLGVDFTVTLERTNGIHNVSVVFPSYLEMEASLQKKHQFKKTAMERSHTHH
ncbi:putative HTH-type (helix-turn-helix) transcriptional regulator [Aeromonas phage ZPAH34]|uniref:putative HTH-type (helix-turn-helix) transcriptional regulator n=1 Tax=Aeromonas phage ZPAH34 TaxID=2924888 RepID=UPI0023293E84|nr:putative HTH-type (helix-turn-helix) transcriptional regulator [Aeromonas phage ZPAH34]UOX39561.1 putative HTH-type (helix-turn-helix) transcriptional regulator [Aeromonas phage ZPAH34]